MLFSVRFSCQVAFSALGFMGTLVLLREELNRVLRVLYLAFLAPILPGWSAIKRLVSLHSASTFNYPRFYLTTCSFKMLFKQYLACLYNHKILACQAPHLMRWPEWAPACGPESLKRSLERKRETVLDPLRRSGN